MRATTIARTWFAWFRTTRRDPLQLARRYADMLNDDFRATFGESGGKLLGHLRFNLTRTQEMLDELLDYSRLQNARPDKQPVDFNELLDGSRACSNSRSMRSVAASRASTPPPTLVVDRRQFQRVFQNLIGNAIRISQQRPCISRCAASAYATNGALA